MRYLFVLVTILTLGMSAFGSDMHYKALALLALAKAKETEDSIKASSAPVPVPPPELGTPDTQGTGAFYNYYTPFRIPRLLNARVFRDSGVVTCSGGS